MFSPLASTRNFLMTVAAGGLVCGVLFFLFDWSALHERTSKAAEIGRLSGAYEDYGDPKKYPYGPPVPENVEALRVIVEERVALLEKAKNSIGLDRPSQIPKEGVDDLALWWTTAFERLRGEVLAKAEAGGLTLVGGPNLGVPGGLVDPSLVPLYANWLQISGELIEMLVSSGVRYVWDISYEQASPDENLSKVFTGVETTVVGFKCYCSPKELASLFYNLQGSNRLFVVEALSVAKNVPEVRAGTAASVRQDPTTGLLQATFTLKTSQLVSEPASAGEAGQVPASAGEAGQ